MLRDDDPVFQTQGNQKNEILELIPSDILKKDLPPALVCGHFHWLNLSTSTIEIRPFEQLWEESSEYWRIDCSTLGQYRVYKGCETLVDVRSPTREMLSACFEGFNVKPYSTRANVARGDRDLSTDSDLLISTYPIDSLQPLRLSVALSHYGLSFFVNGQGELESCDFKDMVYDEDQCIETLFGSKDFLVLRPKTHLAGSSIPKALIPRRILVRNRDNHGKISTRPDEPLYHVYDVDTELGCLVGNGSLASTYLLGHLHARTRGDRPDPLTGKTSLHAALCLLQSAACRSIVKPEDLDDSDSCSPDLLECPQIGTANRKIQNGYYCAYNPGEVPVDIKRIARQAVDPFRSTEPTFMEDRIDKVYLTPESDSDVDLDDILFSAASTVYRWSIDAPTVNTMFEHWAELWANASSTTQDKSKVWANPGFLQTLRSEVHDILEKREGTHVQFQLLFLLPTTVYYSPSRQAAFLSMLIAFAMQMKSHSGDLQIHAGYKISDGYRPTEQVLRDLIQRSQPRSRWRLNREDKVVEHLLENWPCDTPPTAALNLLENSPCDTLPTVVLDLLENSPYDTSSSDSDIELSSPVRPSHGYSDVAGLTASIQQLFSSCYRNFELKERLMRILQVAGHGTPTHPRLTPPSAYVSNERSQWRVTLDKLFSKCVAPELPSPPSYQGNKTRKPSDDMPTLDQLFSSLHANESPFRCKYLTLLETSADTCRESRATHRDVAVKNHVDALQEHYVECRTRYLGALDILKKSLGPTTNLERTLQQFGHWPPITADVLLRYIASTAPIRRSAQWKTCLVSLALLLLELQRARRLLRFYLDGLEEEFLNELDNEQCDG